MGEIRSFQAEQHEDEKNQGRDTAARFTFVRHSQKESGRVFDPDLGRLVETVLSEEGVRRAQSFGAKQLTDRVIHKAYATRMSRTRQTLEMALKGAGLNADIIRDEGRFNAFFSLPGMHNSPEFNARYEAIMETHRRTYIDAHFHGKRFDELTPAQQEEVAEYAEEPAIEWYLAFGDTRPDASTPSPREHAAHVAYKINRLINIPDYMNNGARLDLISGGHKTSTESFLRYVLVCDVHGKRVVGLDTLKDMGGSLQILDSWNLEVHNDAEGRKHVVLDVHREKGDARHFDIDISAVQKLAEEYRENHHKEPLQIDYPRNRV